jgi:hypothetical protein
MLGLELTIALLVLFMGAVPEALLMALFILVLVPVQLIIVFIVWRFYWSILLVGMVLQTLCSLTVLTGSIRVAGLILPISYDNRPIRLQGDNILLNVFLALGLAMSISGVIVFVVYSLIGLATAPDEPRQRDNFDDSMQLQPRRKTRPVDLWQDD